MTSINFDLTQADSRLALDIVHRAKADGLCMGNAAPDHWYEPMTLLMDIAACHLNGCALDLARLKDADGLTFTHDIAGIARHMDRSTGRLTDCFLPRTAAIQHGAAA